MGDITTADLLAVQRNITDAHREDIRELREEFTTHLAEVRTTQRAQNAEIIELRSAIHARTAPLGVLTKRQKKVVWAAATAVGAACLDGLSRLAVWAFSALTHGAAK